MTFKNESKNITHTAWYTQYKLLLSPNNDRKDNEALWYELSECRALIYYVNTAHPWSMYAHTHTHTHIHTYIYFTVYTVERKHIWLTFVKYKVIYHRIFKRLQSIFHWGIHEWWHWCLRLISLVLFCLLRTYIERHTTLQEMREFGSALQAFNGFDVISVLLLYLFSFFDIDCDVAGAWAYIYISVV